MKTLNVYSVISLILGASGALEALVKPFGNPELTVILGGALTALGAIGVVVHAFYGTAIITVPPGVYNGLFKLNGVIVGLLGVGSLLTTYLVRISPSLSPVFGFILAAGAIFASLFAAAFKAKATAKLKGAATLMGAKPV